MPCAVQFLHALHLDPVGSCAFDLRPHLVKQRRQVSHFGFACAILQDGLTLGKSGRHQQVLRAGHGYLFEDDVCSLEALGAGLDVAVLLRNLSAQLLQPFDVKIDGTRSYGASSRQ